LTEVLKNPENKQAKRECKQAINAAGNFLYNLLSIPQRGGGGGGGGWDGDAKKLLKKIKKVSNDLKQK
jgi:hypothetical protein